MLMLGMHDLILCHNCQISTEDFSVVLDVSNSE